MDSVNTQDKASAVFKTAILMSHFFAAKLEMWPFKIQHLICYSLQIMMLASSYFLRPQVFSCC